MNRQERQGRQVEGEVFEEENRTTAEPDAGLDRLAREVIGAAIEVHRVLGPGFLETVYEEAMCVELKLRNIPFTRQATSAVSYKGHEIGANRLDLLVGNKLIVELKATDSFALIHTAQLISYLKATGCQLGLLINFNVTRLKDGVRRVIVS